MSDPTAEAAPTARSGMLWKILAPVLALALVATAVAWWFTSRPSPHITDTAPHAVRVLDLAPAGAEAMVQPMSHRDPVVHHGDLDIMRFSRGQEQFLIAAPSGRTPAESDPPTEEDQPDGDSGAGASPSAGWTAQVPDTTTDCGIDGEVIVCSSTEGTGVAFHASDGSRAPSGNYVIDPAEPAPALPNRVEDAYLSAAVDLDGDTATVAEVEADHLMADKDMIGLVKGAQVVWQTSCPAGTAELNDFGSQTPRWVVLDSVLLFAQPDAIMALDVDSGEELWRLDREVEAWLVDSDELMVQHGAQVEIFDLTAAAQDEADDASDATVAAVPELPAPEPTPEPSPQPSATPETTSALDEVSGKSFLFTSGAGGWRTLSTFSGGGNFTGNWVSPTSDVEYSEFHGTFSVVEEVDETTTRLELTALVPDTPDGEVATTPSGQSVLLSSRAYGFDEGTNFVLYAPGTPISAIPEDVRFPWLDIAPGTEAGTLDFWALANTDELYGMREVDPSDPAVGMPSLDITTD